MDETTRIALIDDNKDYLFTMGTFLERNGFAVSTADDGKKGLELVREEKPDLVLLDVMMESLYSGFEVCKAIRSDPELKDIPIIGVSGMGGELGVRPAKFVDSEYFNPDEFLEKPVDKEKLLDLIGRVLQKAREKRNRPRWKKTLDELTKEA